MLKKDIDKVIREAISERRLIEVVYHNKRRTIEPHDYGVLNGTRKLLAYQLVDETTRGGPNWRLMSVDEIESVHVLNETFPGGRGPSRKPHQWEELFARVKPGNVSYTVLFEPAEEGGYVVTCPALPGLITEGDTYQQARERAIEAMELYLKSLQQDGQPFPPDKKLTLNPVKDEIEVVLPRTA